MPELPEIETLRREIAPKVTGRRIVGCLEGTHPRFRDGRLAQHHMVTGVSRRGKYLLLRTESPADEAYELIVHLGMTGQLHWDVRPADHVHLGLDFADGVLWFRDPRRFGQVRLVPAGVYDGLPTLAGLGPEPDDPRFTGSRVFSFLASSGAPVKARLLEQKLVAGVGNYIADEALWRARIHPAAVSCADLAAARRLCRAVRKVVNDSIRWGGVSERDYVHADGSRGSYQTMLMAYGRAGRPCRRCGTLLVKGRVAGRGTVWCPTCQRI